MVTDDDGASRPQRFWNVTWPQLAPTTFFIFVMSIIAGFQGYFVSIHILTRGGPAGSTTAAVLAMKGRRVVVLPHNPAMPDAAAGAVAGHLKGGGRLISFYGLPARVAAAAGIEPGADRERGRQPRVGRLQPGPALDDRRVAAEEEPAEDEDRIRDRDAAVIVRIRRVLAGR